MIEAQIRMRQQELQEDAERMKNKQTAASTEAEPTTIVESFDTDGTSETGVHNCRICRVLLFVHSVGCHCSIADPVCSVDSCKRCSRQQCSLIPSAALGIAIEESGSLKTYAVCTTD